MQEINYSEVEFEDTEIRCPAVLLLDTSSSMSGAPIMELNKGLKALSDQLKENDVARRRIEVALITFNSNVDVINDFVRSDELKISEFETSGLTKMGTAINKGLDLIEARKTSYKNNGILYYRPWMFMITDGEPQGEDENVIIEASKRIASYEENKKVIFFSIGVQNANMRKLKEISYRPPYKLEGLKFEELFKWISNSIESVVTESNPGEQKVLEKPDIIEVVV